jgi:ubiquinone/menaquinone biosynthesis C-methylase UbiE
MSKKLTPEQVRDYWRGQALAHGRSQSASWSDHMAIELEIRELAKHVRDGDRVLDAGCANGYSTLELARQRSIEIKGVDYIPEMIDQARARLEDEPTHVKARVEFEVADILALEEPPESYDTVVAVRVLINLGFWERQAAAARECARVLKPGGLLLLSEATLQGWRRMNMFRAEWGLAEVPMPAFNQYIDQERLIAELESDLDSISVTDFSSTYFVGTRVLKPLLIQALGITLDVADPTMEWNRFFAQLPAWGDYGVQRLLAFRKRS